MDERSEDLIGEVDASGAASKKRPARRPRRQRSPIGFGPDGMVVGWAYGVSQAFRQALDLELLEVEADGGGRIACAQGNPPLYAFVRLDCLSSMESAPGVDAARFAVQVVQAKSDRWADGELVQGRVDFQLFEWIGDETGGYRAVGRHDVTQRDFVELLRSGALPQRPSSEVSAVSTLATLRSRCRDANLHFRAAARGAHQADRQNDELIGLIRMALADGVLEAHEGEFMLRWLQANDAARSSWPGRALYPRLLSALADDVLSPDEEGELLAILVQVIGSPEAPEAGVTVVSTLPLSVPVPVVEFEGRRFCFTGQCMSGPRARCADAVRRVGGIPQERVTQDLDYLVIGEIGSLEWRHSTHGKKIATAMAYNESGKSSIRIISEQVWFDSLVSAGGAV